MLEKVIYESEIIVCIKDVEVGQSLLIGDVTTRETHHLVEDGQRIAHTSVCLLGYEVERLLIHRVALLFSHMTQMIHRVLDGHPGKVIDLAAGKDGGKNLVLLGGGHDKDDIGRGFLQGLEEGIEGRRRKHVHLVDDEHLVATRLGRNLYLLDEFADVLHGVVGGRIEFVDVERTPLVEGAARLALIARLALCIGMRTVDGLRKNAGTGGLAYTTGTAEEVGMRQLVGPDGIEQGSGQDTLTHHRVEGGRAVLACRNDIFFHD